MRLRFSAARFTITFFVGSHRLTGQQVVALLGAAISAIRCRELHSEEAHNI